MNTAATELTQQQQDDVDAHIGRVNQSIDESVEKDAILALCARLQAAAIKCDDYHVFVSYAPHVGSLSVIVRDKDHDYDADVDSWPDPIINGHIYLNRQDSLEQLTHGIDQLQRLGIDV